MKREIIFDIPDNPEYRVVCRFGYNDFIKHAWWGHVQKKRYYKKWLFFGKVEYKWVEIDKGWWGNDIATKDALKTVALSLFDDVVLLKQRIVKNAMEL